MEKVFIQLNIFIDFVWLATCKIYKLSNNYSLSVDCESKLNEVNLILTINSSIVWKLFLTVVIVLTFITKYTN